MATVLEFEARSTASAGATLMRALDLLGQRYACLDRIGRMHYATDSFVDTVAQAPDTSALSQAINLFAQATSARANITGITSGVMNADPRTVTAKQSDYRLTGAFIAGDVFGFGPCVLVCVEPPAADPFDNQRLGSQFGLTRAQAKVARLLAQGLRNDEIAARLFLSCHTVRHHVEQIRMKVGGHTRAAIAARLGSVRIA